ncbi:MULTISPECIES: PPOX class F420-dependent oxidoreductase [unclassified Streptomyces]|uniref:PPOX class F420-dependent oxidoreductase n=1 Tax=unclassified Streptomyces TaxID=2593676 RepID=UPI0006AF5482|nr:MULTISPECIES: PPOX class F420-dependent oxidoreductase [unclassified Streptomyces]KOX25706.1 pyridoxamine 5'-phosphate oxidase [Streptomyces sp. NRRL F-6491]KOX49209.1 pyridoxamine 5'-phosphate oxidase [Streptomyces sp. NRRL F-6492]
MIPEELRRGRYVSLTTFRKNGTGVATPVWYAVEGSELYAWTRTDSWKVKRLRNDPRVVAAVCDVRGNVPEGAERVTGEARLVTGEELRRVRKLLLRKYTWQFWFIDVPATVFRLGKRPHTGIVVRFP